MFASLTLIVFPKISLTPKGESYFIKNHGTIERIKLQFLETIKFRLSKNPDIAIEDLVKNVLSGK